MLRREVASLLPPVSLSGMLSYVTDSHLFVSYERFRRPCVGGSAMLVFTRFPGRQ